MSAFGTHDDHFAQLVAVFRRRRARSIADVWPMLDVIQDGYQRTWSNNGQVLGQFALPNASEYQVRHR